MERTVTLRQIFSYLQDAERLGVFVRCPISRAPSEIFDCVTCAHYRGLETMDRQSFRLRCLQPDPVSRSRADDAPRYACRPLPSAG